MTIDLYSERQRPHLLKRQLYPGTDLRSAGSASAQFRNF